MYCIHIPNSSPIEVVVVALCCFNWCASGVKICVVRKLMVPLFRIGGSSGILNHIGI